MFFANQASGLSGAVRSRCRRALREEARLDPRAGRWPTATRVLGRIAPDLMRPVQPYRDYSASKERPRDPNRRRSSPSATMSWAGSARQGYLRRCGGARSRVAAIGSRFALTRTVLWLLSLGIFDKAYAQATAGSSDEHALTSPRICSPRRRRWARIRGSPTRWSCRGRPVPSERFSCRQGSSKPEWLTQ